MNGTGYDAIDKVAVSEFTKEQRRRLEAYTAATILEPGETVDHRLQVADYIADGAL